jgi:hypothetical protein
MPTQRACGLAVDSSRPASAVNAPMNDNAKLLAEVLTELCELLENYAPSWYTREHHDKAHAALRLLDKRESEE